MVICKILGIPLKDEPQFSRLIHDFSRLRRSRRQPPKRKGARGEGTRELMRGSSVLAELIQTFIKAPTDTMLEVVNEDGPTGK